MKKLVVRSVKEDMFGEGIRIVFDNYETEVVVEEKVWEEVFEKDVEKVIEELKMWRQNETYKKLVRKVGIHEFKVNSDEYKGFVVRFKSISYRDCYDEELEFDY